MYVMQVEPVLPWVFMLGDTHKSSGDWHILHFLLGAKGVAWWRLLILTVTVPELFSDTIFFFHVFFESLLADEWLQSCAVYVQGMKL